MKLLLINSPLFREQNCLNNEDSLPPIGLGYIATCLKQNNIDVELIDTVYYNISLINLIGIINKLKAEYLGINIFTTNYDLVKELVESINIKTHIIIGGLATKDLYTKIISWSCLNPIDIVIGDGEYITTDIVKNDLKEKPIIFQDNRRVYNVDSKSCYFNKNISLTKLDRSFFENEPVKLLSGYTEANIVTSRGCIYNCTFCAAARSQNIDFPVRTRSASSLIKELEEISIKYPETNSIRILDDLFLKSAKSVTQAISLFNKFNFKWRSMAHINTFINIDQAMISSLKESGCRELFFGIESGSQKILDFIKKPINRDLILETLKKLFEAKIDAKCYFIYGFPDESRQDMDMTFCLAKEIKNLSIKYGVIFRTSVFQFRPYHGTKIYTEIQTKRKNEDLEPIVPDSELTNYIGRSQFNFHGENYSNVCLDEIHNYICRTNSLNDFENSPENRPDNQHKC